MPPEERRDNSGLIKVNINTRWHIYISAAMIIGTILFVFRGGRIWEILTSRINEFPKICDRLTTVEGKVEKLESIKVDIAKQTEDISGIKTTQTAILLELSKKNNTQPRNRPGQ